MYPIETINGLRSIFLSDYQMPAQIKWKRFILRGYECTRRTSWQFYHRILFFLERGNSILKHDSLLFVEVILKPQWTRSSKLPKKKKKGTSVNIENNWSRKPQVFIKPFFLHGKYLISTQAVLFAMFQHHMTSTWQAAFFFFFKCWSSDIFWLDSSVTEKVASNDVRHPATWIIVSDIMLHGQQLLRYRMWLQESNS